MSSNNPYNDMSDLEREFELEMDDHNYSGSIDETEMEYEDESADSGYDQEEYGQASLDDEYDHDENEDEYEYEADYEHMSYGERMYELSQREFESEWERNEALDNIFEEIEREYFLGRINRAFKKVTGNSVIRRLARK